MPFLTLPNEILLEICTSPLEGLLKPALRRQILKRRSHKFCRRAIYHAAERQDHPTVKLLLESGVLDIVKRGRWLLNHAVCSLSEEGLTTLLACGVDPNTPDGRGRTPLICATAGRLSGAVRALLADARVEVNWTWIPPDFTALHLAVWNGFDDIVKLFLACPRTAVNLVQNARGPMTDGSNNRALGTFVGERIFGVEVALRSGWAPIHGAVVRKDPKILIILLQDERVDVNILSCERETPLFLAVKFHNKLAVRLLLAIAKNRAPLAIDGILHMAVPWAGTSMVEILLQDSRVDVNWTNHDQRTALHIAASVYRVDLIRLLLNHKKIDVGKFDERESSARDLVLPDLPAVARWFTVRQILDNKGMAYLDPATDIEQGGWKLNFSIFLGSV
ncbi:ankyrin [Choiromyces venosus 120613-1]|uniref:Ankyrin n=1 Tax=Choiromyces venosus 120613-1 TaxID=1336337 RepID=A0A3N4JDX5_9PEZI|nr:ankyrin [Choiromyces venosus 120613-1]